MTIKLARGYSIIGWKNAAGVNTPKIQTGTIYCKPAMRPIDKKTAGVLRNIDNIEYVSIIKPYKKKTIKGKKNKPNKTKTLPKPQKTYKCCKCGAVVADNKVTRHQERCRAGFKRVAGMPQPKKADQPVKKSRLLTVNDKFNQLLKKASDRLLKKKRNQPSPPPLIPPSSRKRK